MTDFLIRRFIRDPQDTASAQGRYVYGQLAGFTGLACNVLLFAVKLLAGLLAGSLAIVADAFNNLSDAGSVIVTLVGFKMSHRPADDDHPFGHGRVEYLSTLGVAVLIILAGFELASSGLDKILHPSESRFSLLTIVILAIAIAVKLWMAVFYKNIGKRIRSDALIASGVDSRNDVICTALVLVSAVVGLIFSVSIDGYVGLAVALFVMWSGFSVIRETISPLLGEKPDPELVQGIEETVLANEGIVGIHDMMVHDYGPGRIFVSLHAEVPAKQDILVSHDIVDCVEQQLLKRFNVISCIHMDPIDTDDPETVRLKELAAAQLAAIDERLTLHDFRVVHGETHTNLIFDVVVPFDYSDKDALAADIRRRIHESDERLFTVIKLENRYA